MRRRGFDPRWIVGKTVARVEMNSYRVPVDEGSGTGREVMHYPQIFFSDGSSIEFTTEEHPDGGEYGTSINYKKA